MHVGAGRQTDGQRTARWPTSEALLMVKMRMKDVAGSVRHFSLAASAGSSRKNLAASQRSRRLTDCLAPHTPLRL